MNFKIDPSISYQNALRENFIRQTVCEIRRDYGGAIFTKYDGDRGCHTEKKKFL